MVSNPPTFKHPSSASLESLHRDEHVSHSVLLHNISWYQYEGLLELLGDRSSTRIAYDNGGATAY